MGILDMLKGQLIDVIEWKDDSNDTMVHRYDRNGKEIMMGAQLTVRESQVAIMVNEGKLADVFQPGRYELSTQNMPILTALKSWKYGFNSPFKAEHCNTVTLTAGRRLRLGRRCGGGRPDGVSC